MENHSHTASPTVAIRVEESPYSVGSAPQLTDDDNTINLNSSFNQISSPSPHQVNLNHHNRMSAQQDSPYEAEDSLSVNMNQKCHPQGKQIYPKAGQAGVSYSDPNSNAFRIYQMDYNNNNNNNSKTEEPNRGAFKPMRPPPLLISSQQKQYLHQQLINHYSPTSSSYLSSAPPSILSSTLSSGYNTSPMIQQHHQNQEQSNHGGPRGGQGNPQLSTTMNELPGAMHKYGGPSDSFDEVHGLHTVDSDASFNLHPPNSSYLDYHYGSGGSISGGSESGSVSGIPPEPPKELYGNLLAMSSDSSLYEQTVNRQHAFQQPLFKLNMGDSNSDILSDLRPDHNNYSNFNSSSGDLAEFEQSEVLVDHSIHEDKITTTIPPSMIGNNNAEIATTTDNRNSQATITGIPGVPGMTTPNIGYANPQNVSLGLPGEFMYSLSELEFGNPSFDLVVDSSFDDTSGFPTFSTTSQSQVNGMPNTNLAYVPTGSNDSGGSQHPNGPNGASNSKAYPHQNPLLMTRHLQNNSDSATTPLTSFDTYLSDSNSHSFVPREGNANNNNNVQSNNSISQRRVSLKNLMLVQNSPSSTSAATQEDDIQSSPLLNSGTDIQQYSPRHLIQRRRLQHQRSPLREHTEALPPKEAAYHHGNSYHQSTSQAAEFVPQLQQQAHYQNQFNELAQQQQNLPDGGNNNNSQRKTMMYNASNGHMSQQLLQMYNGFPSILSNVPTSAPPLAPLPPLPPFESGGNEEQQQQHHHRQQHHPQHRELSHGGTWQKNPYPQLNTFYHNGKKPSNNSFNMEGPGIPIPQGFPPPPPMGMHPVGSSGASSDRSDSSVGSNGMIKKKHTRRRLLPRSKNGCWICRIKHLKCDEKRPVCASCHKFGIVCDYSPQKPDYVLDKNIRKQKLIEISLVRKLKHKDIGRKK
ncbi:uncharacterized protein KQ657_000241 [Scheffersomyces spartinae]|uniref:Zn(2)-C6 fungal-type domain-containing protein n=1 Tax=Scheffersomyces spartinae TaxID=45513 RepID=A0A9P7VDL5_9ASCO|nr:uncharacterized protein KQ657_000241 [Scheffersomyces spartinae]KAG7196228.1 hypothetical protein KQ657_000241 [Scheffersomyces spartinae]